jgi:hypothetical protein
MARVQGTCAVCGVPLHVQAAAAFAGAELAAPLCPACTDQQFLDGGGAVLTLRREPEGSRFALGKITITPGAVAALADAAQHAVEFLVRHVRGDWGAFGQCDQIQLSDDERRRGWEATDDTAKINKWNVLNGQDTVMSEYVTPQGKPIWVVTRLDRGNGTTVLLPEEY